MMTSRKPDEYDKAQGRELARLRRAAGLTQEQLGLQLEISSKQVGKYERGQSRVPAGRLKAAIAILRRESGAAGGFSEDQASYGVPASAKGVLLRTLRGLEDGVKFCIDVVERL
ncbi:helix-turn-helix transcriptional regulator [Mesorhizobium sp. LHD-90]|uniref:helix-turn-helix domain-containing protein n=1 Tax=Mesorhizobium sp. LHD-90 TaxID=3071414 RepID=UPI0027E126B8|nr:helix-turn-helix transcriptional regulator [Mesorhizobium sp. LHD-90]MDQ6433059.1 helix-turn-helix transcriptional regulator [Mesorhizobium sp. LHD-90]